MSFLNQNANALPYAGNGTAPVLEGVLPTPVPRPDSQPGSRRAPFSQPFVPQGGSSPGGPPDAPSFNLQILRSLRMHSTLAVLVGLAVCLLLVAFALKQPRTYTASSVIYVEPMVARNLNEQGVPGFDQFRYGSFLDQQIQTIVRPDVLTAALRTLPVGTWRGPRESEQSAVARLSKALTVERVLTSYQITVQLKTSDPQAAAAIVNAVTNAYLQRGREDEFKQADLREQILSEERDRVKQELETDRREQAALGASMGLASPAEGAGNPYDADLAGLRSQLATARQARDVAAAQLASVSGPDAAHVSGLNATADDLINGDPGLSAKKAAVNARRVVLETQMAGMTPSNPQYRQAQDEIADLNRALDAQTAEVRAQTQRRIQDKLRTDLARTADVESKVNAQLGQATGKATGAGPKLQRAAELATDIQRLTARYTTVDDSLNALELETNGPGMAHVPLPAAVPLAPDPNRRDLFLMAALPLGLFFGVSAAVIARLRDRRIYLGADLEHAIGFAPIAVLPAREDVSERVIDEYVLRLAAGVESAYRTAGAQSFVVTAVSPDTGTGTLLRDLAAKLEELRLRVLVVRASELLVTSQETLEHQAATAALIAIGAAQPTAQTGEGIASARLDRMKSQQDIVLIDSASLLHSAETEYAARCADATILIAESAVTQTPELAAATALLSRLRVTGVGAVLDQVKLEQADKPFRGAVRAIEQRSLDGVAARKPPVAVVAQRETDFAPSPAQQTASAKATPTAAPAVEPRVPVKPLLAIATVAQPIPRPAPVSQEPVNPAPAPVAAPRPLVAAAPVIPATRAPLAAPAPPPPAAPLPASSRPSPEVQVVAPLAVPLAAAHAKLEPAAVSASPADIQDPKPPAIAPAVPAPDLPRVYARPPGIQRSFKNWTVFPEISSEESEQVLAKPEVRRRFELLGDLAAASPAAQGPAAAANVALPPFAATPTAPVPAESPAPAPPEVQQTVVQTVAASLRVPPATSADEPEKVGDPNAVGRFISEKDKIGAVPSYTRSRIRLAFKEQEVNSKTTWFSKLFRGDPPAAFKIVPDENNEDETGEPPFVPKLQWEQAPARLLESTGNSDPVPSHLLNRIKKSSEFKVAPRPQPVAVEPGPVVASSPLVPFVERNYAPLLAEIEEYRVPAVAAAPLVPVAAPAASQPSLTPPLAPAIAQPVSEPRQAARPLRPLTFQQLAGGIEAEALPERPQHPEQPVFHPPPPPEVQPERQAAAEPPPQAPEPPPTPSAGQPQPQPVPVATPLPLQQAAVSLPSSQWEIGAPATIPAPAPASADSFSGTAISLWPAKGPIVPTTNHAAEPAPTPEPPQPFATEVVEAIPVEVLQPASSPEEPAHVPDFLAPSPTARRGAFERIPIVPDPLTDPFTDPAPAVRPYRLEPNSSVSERSSAHAPTLEPAESDPEPAPEPVATVPPGTSFPPDHDARLHMFARRRSDREGATEAPGMTRRWKLLSQFEPVLSDPLPAHRKGYTRSTDLHPSRQSDEG